MASAGSNTFQNAVAYINNLPAGVSTTTQLQLYAAYKCVTVAIKPTTSRPSFFDMTGRAKWDAWDALGQTLQDEADPVQAAEELYLQHARNLGWSESQGAPTGTSGASSETHNDAARGGGGMGVSVSVPVASDATTKEDHSVHGYAVNGDVEGLRALLEDRPDLVNSRDEFGYTPLHLAADRGHLEAVRLLLSKGADVTLKDQDGDTSLDIAAAAKHDAIVQMLRERSKADS